MSRVRSPMFSKKTPFSEMTMLAFILLAAILSPLVTASASELNRKNDQNPVHRGTAIKDFIKAECNFTTYPEICVSSLSSYADSLKAKQSELVKVAVKVSLLKASNTSALVAGLRKKKGLKKTERAALQDCVETFGDTLDQLKESLAELKHLRSKTFQWQMSNVQTWLSAALTNEDTCLDGLQNVKGHVKVLVKGKVHNLCKLISNALALVNRFATTGGRGIPV
eukprot:Gb_28157 [translate_table: standard]